VSASELVDVVDGDDRVIGTASRGEIRSRNLWHRACYVVALDREARVFVHLRTPTKDIFPSHYDLVVGGVLGAGEDYRAAAEREVREELGVEPHELSRVGKMRYEDDSNRVIGEIFDCRVTPPLRLQAEEVVSGEWLRLDEIEERILSQPFCPDGVLAFRSWRRSRNL
jgi:isopentenyldiphosphate isomerase